MYERRSKDVLEVVGMSAIVASLIFLGLQVRQDQLIARAEVNALLVEGSLAILEIRTRPEFAKTWAKMLKQPRDLSIDEILQINSFLRSVKESFDIHCLMLTIRCF